MKNVDVEMSGKGAKAKKKYIVHPRHGWAIVRKLSLEQEVTDAGVIVDKSQAKTYQAEIVETSAHITDLRPGQLVLITAFSMTMEDLEELTGEKDLLMVRDEEIYCWAEEIEF